MIPDSAHNEALSGDTLYSAFLNHEWREIVMPFIVAGMERIAAGIEDESERQTFETRYYAMIQDFYDEENMDFTPVGTIALFPDDALPPKWQHCTGIELSRDIYSELFAVIGTRFGASSSTVFKLPDMRNRMAYGANDDSQIGVTGGAETHTLTLAEIPAHAHAIAKGNGIGNAITAVEGDAVAAANTQNTGNNGGGGSHNNMPPYMRMWWMIKAEP